MRIVTSLRPILALAFACGLAASAGAQSTTPALTKVKIGCTATTDCANALVAKEDGIFMRNGIDADLVLIGLNSNIPAALMSDSIQIGGPTPSVFLQAVDGGLDLVAVAGASSTAKDTAETVAVVSKTGAAIKTPKDFEGKKVGAPGLGAFLHVLFRQWLIQNNVDPKKVTFVEVAFPTMSDVLKAGTVDAVVTAEPVLSRIKAAQTGEVVAHFLADLPETRPAILYASTRDWAAKNGKLVEAFRASVTEASAIVNANPDKARAAVSQFTKMPLDVLKNIKLSRSDPAITTEQLTWWTEVMNRQEMLQSKPDVGKLVHR
ncbi:MAG TPA: ABC transporter substrate-binding protein [Microvirga sp.]|jgi:NitT/TauT family transport system substrate-binding protein|nr:ABC transporter substrate-binding protein [Microvirga sp.]